MYKLIVSDSENVRIDKFLSGKINDLSRSDLSKLFIKNKVLVNNILVKQNYKVKLNDSIEVDYEVVKFDINSPMKLPVIYQDDSVVVIDKPAGILSHSKGRDNQEQTVETMIHSLLTDNDYDRAGIVHRLDRATSGVMICAKTKDSYKWLQSQFSQRKVIKVYYAIVSGHFDIKSAVIDLPIMRDQKNKSRFKVDSRGKASITQYTVISENPKYSLVELIPKTGRTHQLRVHLKYLKHPIVGDNFYDGEPSDRLYLHAAKLSIKLISGESKTFESKMPEEFNEKMKYN